MLWEEFVSFAKEIVDKSKEIGDNWELIGSIHDFSLYMMKCERHIVEGEKTALGDIDCETFSDVSEATFNKAIVLDFEYHITYSISYMVPVLSFNAIRPNGTSLLLNEAWDLIVQNGVNSSDFHSILTQMEHPVLQKPFLTMHPCKTQELLQKFPNSNNHLITFISLVGPYVGLRCKLEYGCENINMNDNAEK